MLEARSQPRIQVHAPKAQALSSEAPLLRSIQASGVRHDRWAWAPSGRPGDIQTDLSSSFLLIDLRELTLRHHEVLGFRSPPVHVVDSYFDVEGTGRHVDVVGADAGPVDVGC